MAIENLELKKEISLIKEKICEYSNIKKTFFVLLVIYVIALGAIIMADVEYIDDMGRKYTGNAGWENYSRYLSNFLSHIIHTNTYLADISPLTQIIAIAEITVASMIVIIVFSNTKTFSIWNIIAVLPLGLSPYFLECISYKYDSPYMALSILASIIPLLFYSRSRKLYLTITTFCILISCTTYQASLGIFPISIVILLFVKWINDENKTELLRIMINSIIGYLLGVFIYWIFLMNTNERSGIYALSEMPKGIISNIKKYLNYVYADFDIKWIVCIAILLCSFIILSTVISRKSRVLTCILSISVIILSICLSFGLYIAMLLPSYNCRAMYGFGVCIAIIAVTCSGFKVSLSIVPKFAGLALGWCLVVFCFVYANAIEEQQRYVEFRMEMVLNALDSLNVFDAEETINIEITGTTGFSPIVEKMPQYQNTALNRLVKNYFAGGDWYWSTYYFYHYYDIKNYTTTTDLEKEDMSLLYDEYYESIYESGSDILIELKQY